MNENRAIQPPPDDQTIEKKVLQRAGGRHLVFRIKKGRFWFLPKPYALISNIQGSIWIFYGIGQVWLTHRKLRTIGKWSVRVPRFTSRRIIQIIEQLEPDISEFIEHIDHLDLIGTLVIERRVIEFHWTVPRNQRGHQAAKPNPKAIVDLNFNNLATSFAKLQLVGQEGVDDTSAEQVRLLQKQ